MYRLMLGKCYMETDKFAEASAAFEKLVKQNPDKIDYYFMWSTALLHAGKMKEALEVYDKIEQILGVTEEISVQRKEFLVTEPTR